MFKLTHTLLIPLSCALALSFAGDAFAQRAARSTQAVRAPRPAAARQVRPSTAAPRNRLAPKPFYRGNKAQPNPVYDKSARLKSTGSQVGVQEAFKDLYRGAHEYEAAAMYIVPKKGIKQTVVKEQGDYGSNQSLEVAVTGLGAGGTYAFDFLGSVSTHNEGGNYEGAALNKFIADRVSRDGVKLTHIKPDGSRVDIVANHPSDIVTHLSKSVNLVPGKNVIRYERTDRASGRIVSAQGLYSEWRTVVVNWDGK